MAINDTAIFTTITDITTQYFGSALLGMGVISIIVFCVCLFFVNLRPLDAIVVSAFPFVVFSFYTQLYIGWGLGIFIVVIAYLITKGVQKFTSGQS